MARLERGIVRWASLMLLASIATVAAFSAAATPAWANTITVTNTNDSGAGSLRQAITDANNVPGENTITFAPSIGSADLADTIALESALPDLSSVNIEGPGAERLTVTPANDSGCGPGCKVRIRIFTVGAGATVSIEDLSMSQGG